VSNETPAYFAVIPANVRYCKSLQPAARLFYGELTALCSKEGYCWAENPYFMELYDVDRGTIKRWLRALEKEGFIRITFEDQKTHSGRKIWILAAFSHSNIPDAKMHQTSCKNAPLINTKNKTSSKDKEKTTTAAPPKASPVSANAESVVFSSKTRQRLRALPGSSETYVNSLERKHTEQEVARALSVVDKAKGPVHNALAFFKAALKNGWKPNEEIDPKQYAESLFTDGKKYKGWTCEMNSKSIWFHSGLANIGVDFLDKAFKTKFSEMMERFLGTT
jgi:hypothetical protein